MRKKTQAQRFLEKSQGAWTLEDVQKAISLIDYIHDTPNGRSYQFKDGSLVIEKDGVFRTA